MEGRGVEDRKERKKLNKYSIFNRLIIDYTSWILTYRLGAQETAGCEAELDFVFTIVHFSLTHATTEQC